MIEVVPPGPGSIRVPADVTADDPFDWEPAEVSLYVEAVEPQEGTSTIAVLDLEATEFGGGRHQRIQIELTQGDVEFLTSHLQDVLDPSEIVSVTGISPRCDICGKAQQPEGEWNGETGNHVACETQGATR